MKNNVEVLKKKRLYFLFGVYFVILLWFVVFKCNDLERLCPEWQVYRTIWGHFLDGAVPFRGLVNADGINFSEVLLVLANFVLFLPMGMLFPFFMGKKKSVLVVFLIALGIEIFQLFTGWGGYDTADVIVTFLGGAAGVCVHTWWIARWKEETVNKLALWLSVLCFPLAVFAIVNTALNFPPIYFTELY